MQPTETTAEANRELRALATAVRSEDFPRRIGDISPAARAVNAFVRAASPTAVLALLEERDALAARVADLETHLDG